MLKRQILVTSNCVSVDILLSLEKSNKFLNVYIIHGENIRAKERLSDSRELR